MKITNLTKQKEIIKEWEERNNLKYYSMVGARVKGNDIGLKEEKKDIFKTKLEEATGKEVIKHPNLDIYGF